MSNFLLELTRMMGLAKQVSFGETSAAQKLGAAPLSERKKGRQRSAFALGDSGDLKSGPVKDGPGRWIASAEERKSEAAALRKTLEADREAEEREEEMLHV
jgi:hypothetical protein